jgi:hypothetical protein
LPSGKMLEVSIDNRRFVGGLTGSPESAQPAMTTPIHRQHAIRFIRAVPY